MDQPIVITYSTIILGCVGGFIVTIISLAVFVTCHQHRKEKRRRMLALKQEKRHNVEMTTLLNRSSSPCLSPRNHVHADGKINRNGDIHAVKDDDGFVGKDLMDGPSFRSFQDDDAIPNINLSVVSVEKHNSPRRSSPKGSPRKDSKPEQNSLPRDSKKNTLLKRRLSLETVHSERSDIWKPNVSPLPNQRSLDYNSRYGRDSVDHDDYHRAPVHQPRRVYGFELFRDPRYGPAPDIAHMRRVSRSASNELDLYDDYSNFDNTPYDDRREYRTETLPYSRTYSGPLSDNRYRVPRDHYDSYDYPRRDYYAPREYRDYRDPREYRRDFRDRDYGREYNRSSYDGDDRRRASYGEHLNRSPRREPREYKDSRDSSYSREPRVSYPDRQSSAERIDRRRMTEDRPNRSPSKSYRDTTSPDVFYTRPNRGTTQHHPV